MSSALKLFASRGIDKTSTAQISRNAGIASGTLFVHFSTKQELIDKLYIKIKTAAFKDRMSLINPDASAEDNIRKVSKELMQYYLQHYSELVFLELVENDPLVSKEAVEAGKDVYRPISEHMSKWIEQGQIKNVELELLEGLIWQMGKVIIKQHRLTGRVNIDRIYLDMIWEAISL